jgi:hypothetical protein
MQSIILKRALFALTLPALIATGCAGTDLTGIDPSPEQEIPIALATRNFVLDIPTETPSFPIYANLAGAGSPIGLFVQTDGEWVAIDFIRDPNCIPAGFNLLQFFDLPGAFRCPLTVNGKEWWLADDLASAEPYETIPPLAFQVQLDGLGGVPIYFVPLAELNASMLDGALTLGELESLPSLLVGQATRYQFNQHNSNQGMRPGHSSTVAAGTLEDGRRFLFRHSDRENETLNIQIEFK